MSKKLSLKEALERQARGQAADRPPSESVAPPSGSVAAKVHLRRIAAIKRPIDLARLLVSCGLSLRKAHETVGRLAAGDIVANRLTGDPKQLAPQFEGLGVEVRQVQLPTVDPRTIREQLGLTQEEFADRFFMNVDTVRNWEQRRNAPDPPTSLLLKVIEDYPQIVEAILCNLPAVQIKTYTVSTRTGLFQTNVVAGPFSALETTRQNVGNLPTIKQLGATMQTTVDAQSYTWIVRPGNFVEFGSRKKLEVASPAGK
jgi:DNA-binding transcriptional regulator YiaG